MHAFAHLSRIAIVLAVAACSASPSGPVDRSAPSPGGAPADTPPDATLFDPYLATEDGTRFLSAGEGDFDANPNGRKWSLDLALRPGTYRVRYREYRRVSAATVTDETVRILDGTWTVERFRTSFGDEGVRMVIGDLGKAVPDDGPDGARGLLLGLRGAPLSVELEGVATTLHPVESNVPWTAWE